MAVSPIPAGFHAITPYLILRNGAKAIEYYQTVFGAVQLLRLDQPDGRLGHAELKIGDSPIMLADEFPEMGVTGPQTIGGSPVCILLYVEDVDKVFQRALAAGGEEVRPVRDQFYGDRSGTLRDPFGHIWTIATHQEDLSKEELDRRFASMASGQPG